MAKRMLIDATHPEETRVVILNGSRLEEFDFETSTKKQIKGNIYLAKVTRVEPSLQAAFVEYGGNRHGFLAFSEIHPDYYRIPVADREALLAAQAREADDDDEDTESSDQRRRPRRRRGGRDEERGGDRRGRRSDRGGAEAGEATEAASSGEDPDERDVDGGETDAGHDREGVHDAPAGGEAAQDEPAPDRDPSPPTMAATDGIDVPSVRSDPYPSEPAPSSEIDARGDDRADADSGDDRREADDRRWDDRQPDDRQPDDRDQDDRNDDRPDDAPQSGGEQDDAARNDRPEAAADAPTAEEIAGREEAAAEAAAAIETLGGDELEEVRRHRSRSIRQYKIQEVVKRRQIMLVQVTKEERGNQGAALTTYLSLAGRYCVLMPNSGRGGGVSRKIVNASDRRRLKSLIDEMQLPDGMSVIVRTAGSERTKAEIKRDLEYLLRLWDEIRELTLQSAAPALIYEEGKLIKRAIRDLYARDIEEILVEGEDAYREAKDFMRMLMPSHSKRVQPYRDPGIPLFNRFQIDQQIDAIHSPNVQLKSGGYIVINPTEALVSIDVNSGRSTRERNIEETAYRTNLEAADEIARQLRLRDLAGLIVIDFIDMEEPRNQHSVERRLKEAMKADRARIQIGRISPFGLLELSRQRLRPSIFETSTQPCPHCGGTGHIRSIESTALHVLRAIEEEGLRRRSAEIRVTVPTGVALYILNQKRAALTEIERRYAFVVQIDRDDTLIPPDLRLDRLRVRAPGEAPPLPIAPPPIRQDIEDMAADEAAAAADEAEADAEDVEAEREDEVAATSPEGARPARGEEDEGQRRRRRRRRRGRGRDGEGAGEETGQRRSEDRAEGRSDDPQAPVAQGQADAAMPATDEGEAGEAGAAAEGQSSDGAARDEESERRRRRRGRRGGRRRANGRREDEPAASEGAPVAVEDDMPPPRLPLGDDTRSAVEAMFDAIEREALAGDSRRTAPIAPPVAEVSEPDSMPVPEAPAPALAESAPPAVEPAPPAVEPAPPAVVIAKPTEEPPATPVPAPTADVAAAAAPSGNGAGVVEHPPEPIPAAAPVAEEPPRSPRKGWWQRLVETR